MSEVLFQRTGGVGPRRGDLPVVAGHATELRTAAGGGLQKRLSAGLTGFFVTRSAPPSPEAAWAGLPTTGLEWCFHDDGCLLSAHYPFQLPHTPPSSNGPAPILPDETCDGPRLSTNRIRSNRETSIEVRCQLLPQPGAVPNACRPARPRGRAGRAGGGSWQWLQVPGERTPFVARTAGPTAREIARRSGSSPACKRSRRRRRHPGSPRSSRLTRARMRTP